MCGPATPQADPAFYGEAPAASVAVGASGELHTREGIGGAQPSAGTSTTPRQAERYRPKAASTGKR